jgi:serine/threonine protein kinase/tetratricopeptide (TPR) repeat protein
MSDAKTDAKAIFLEALECRGADELKSFLDKACGTDPALRARVEELLRADRDAGAFLGGAEQQDVTRDQAGAECPGTIIGPYKLLEQIGEGGFGLVFMAEQQQPVRRKVALKVLKPGMDTRQVIARFEAERQALALMDHPNIARVLDAGETASGRPHFVMELVKGVPITDYCDQNRLNTRERLALFSHVCHAVQHAHHKGIIHRDLKPSNVMVTLHDSAPVVKVIDFGIAKALGQQLTDKTLFTGFAQMVGTPMYMSPEQAQLSGLDIDTRSDIYSLGVLLYELLAGVTPFDGERMRTAGYDEMRRIIREEDPPSPSTRLSTLGQTAMTISAERQSDPKRLCRLLRGELDWIVMKAIEKDRTRRYETANELARDVDRYLNDLPVAACPPSSWYRFRKFTRRHKAGLRNTAAAALVLLAAGAGVSWALMDQAAHRRELSRRRAETERTVSAVLIKTQQLRKLAGEAPSVTSQEADAVLALWRQAEASLSQAEAALGTGTADDRLRQWVLDVREAIERGRRQAERKAALLRDLDEARMTRSVWMGTHFDDAGAVTKYAAAFAAYGLDLKPGQTAELARAIRAEQPAIREALIVGLDSCGDAALRAKTGELANPAPAIAAAADDDSWRRRYRAAATSGDATALRALSSEARRLSSPPSSLHLLAMSLNSYGASDEALTLLRWARGRYLTDFWLHFELGTLLEQGDDKSPVTLEEAIGCLRTALALRPAAGAAHNNLGNCLRHRKQQDEAMAEYRKAIELDPKNAVAHTNFGNSLADTNQLDAAIAEYRTAIDLNPKYALAHRGLGLVFYHKSRADEAIAEYRTAIELEPKNADAHNNLGTALKDQNRFDEAIVEHRKAIELAPKFASAHSNLGTALLNKSRWDEAGAAFRKAIELDPKFAVAHFNLALAHRYQNQFDEAIAEYKKAIELAPKFAVAHYYRGVALKDKNRLDEAIAEYRQVIDLKADYQAEAQCNLADILKSRGELSASLEFYTRGHALGSKRKDWSYPSAQWVADAERLVRLDAKLADVLGGKATAADNRERLALMEVCRLKRCHVAIARLYADAFASDPTLAGDLKAYHRYNAACSASLAADGQGTDADQLDDQEHRRLRQQALAWLRADLEQWAKQAASGKPEDRQDMREKLELWQRDTDLASVRDRAPLGKLAAKEQEAWQKLWADVAELLKTAGNAKR